MKSSHHISEAHGEDVIHAELHDAEDAVNDLVIVELNQNQYDALVSLVYFLKRQDFSESSLLRYLNRGEYLRAANEFPRYTVAGGYTQEALVKRRYAEKAMFLQKDEET